MVSKVTKLSKFLYGNVNLNTNEYLIIVRKEIFPFVLYEDGNYPAYFQQGGASFNLVFTYISG